VTKSFQEEIFTEPLALAFSMAIALAELGSISERRTYQLISGSRNLPAF
jgi:histidine ammonia-lyase